MIVTPLVNTTYKGKAVAAGEPFDADKKWADDMVNHGLAAKGRPAEFVEDPEPDAPAGKKDGGDK